MISYIILLIIGFILLIKGADLFVDSASSCAINLKVSKMIIALTIVAFGTSTPELAISFQGVLSNNGEIVISNIVGSSIVNILLAIGLAALVRPIKVKNDTIKKELPFHFVIISIFSFLLFDGLFTGNVKDVISRKDAIVLFLLFLLFLYYIFTMHKKKRFLLFEKNEKPKYKLITSIIFGIIGLFLIFIGSELAVDNAILLADKINVSDKLITMIVLVVATSIPEIVMSITSSKKGEFDMVLGNIIGTNIFNIGVVLAIPVMIFGDITSIGFGIIDLIVIVAASLLLFIFSIKDKVISKKEGLFMLLIFVCYYGYIIFLQ